MAQAPPVFTDLVLERCDLELEVNGCDHHTADLCRRLVVAGPALLADSALPGAETMRPAWTASLCAMTGEYYLTPSHSVISLSPADHGKE